MMELDLEETVSQLKKLFSNSTPSKKLYPIINEQKFYVRKLNILFDGFHSYLKNELQLIKNLVQAIMEDIETFLQIFHLDYSEKLLSELDEEELNYFLQDFLPRKWLNFSKNDLKSMCKSLNIFIGFLKEKLHYYLNDGLYKKMIKALNANQIIKTIDWDDEDLGDENASNPNGISLKYRGNINGMLSYSLENGDGTPATPDTLNNFLKLIENFRSVREEEEQSEMELKKNLLIKSINLETDLNQWYNDEEIKVGKEILENVLKSFNELKNLNKNGLLAAIDYALSEIFSKKTPQSEIAKRHNTSPATLIKHRYIIAPCIPLEYFYPVFFSGDDLKLMKEKTYIFKVSNYYNGRDWSKFELAESSTLDDLHHAIQLFMDVDDFYDEHLYSFFMNGKEWDDSTEYTGPPEFQQERCSRLTNIQLKKLKLGYKQRFLYLYDYGDCLKYNVTIIGLGIHDDTKTYPYRLK